MRSRVNLVPSEQMWWSEESEWRRVNAVSNRSSVKCPMERHESQDWAVGKPSFRHRVAQQKSIIFFSAHFVFSLLGNYNGNFLLRLSWTSFYNFFSTSSPLSRLYALQAALLSAMRLKWFSLALDIRSSAEKSSTHDWRERERNKKHAGAHTQDEGEYKKRCQFLINFSP